MMAAIAKYRDDHSGSLITGGTSTAYTLTTNQVFDTLAHMDKMSLVVKFHTANGASATLNVDGLGANPLRIASGSAITANAVGTNEYRLLIYLNATTEWLLIGSGAGNLYAPSGTAMFFAQATAPVGWTQLVTNNNIALRLVNTANGGNVTAGTAFTASISLGSVTIAQANLPNYTLTGGTAASNITGISVSAITGLLGGGGSGFAAGAQGGSAINFVDPGHTHTVSVPSGGSGSALSLGNLSLAFMDIMLATKN
jgi:hypothetical protein